MPKLIYVVDENSEIHSAQVSQASWKIGNLTVQIEGGSTEAIRIRQEEDINKLVGCLAFEHKPKAEKAAFIRKANRH
jgi:hypothetical protein